MKYSTEDKTIISACCREAQKRTCGACAGANKKAYARPFQLVCRTSLRTSMFVPHKQLSNDGRPQPDDFASMSYSLQTNLVCGPRRLSIEEAGFHLGQLHGLLFGRVCTIILFCRSNIANKYCFSFGPIKLVGLVVNYKSFWGPSGHYLMLR